MKKTLASAALLAAVLLLSPAETAAARYNDGLYVSWAADKPSAAMDHMSFTEGDFTYALSLSGSAVVIDCDAAGSVSIPASVTKDGKSYLVRGIASGAFSDSVASSVALPDSVVYAENGAFAGCTSVKSITATENFIYAGRAAFEGTAWYSSLSDEYAVLGRVLVKYGGVDVAEVPEGIVCVGGFAFSDVRSAVLPESVRYIADGAFEECRALSSVSVPDGVTYVGKGAFLGCSSLKNIAIPKSVSVIGAGAFLGSPWYASLDEEYCVVGDGVLIKYCGGDSVEVPAGVRYISDAFAYSGVSSVMLPDSLRAVGDGAFAYCLSLESVKLPGSVVEIGRGAFMGCGALRTVRLSRALRVIGDEAFAACPSLRQLIFTGDAPLAGEDAFPKPGNSAEGFALYYDVHSEDFISGKWQGVPSAQIMAAEYVSGDADGNGRVNMRDILVMKQHIADLARLPVYPGVDADDSGSIDGRDVLYTKRIIMS